MRKTNELFVVSPFFLAPSARCSPVGCLSEWATCCGAGRPHAASVWGSTQPQHACITRAVSVLCSACLKLPSASQHGALENVVTQEA